MTAGIVVADSVTALPAHARGAVLVTGSHGGLIAAHYALAAGVRAAIFNDAGRGLDDAGVAGVIALDGVGMAAAAVAHTSARIAVGADTLARGIVSVANQRALSLGVAPGMPCRLAAVRLDAADAPMGSLPRQQEARVFFVDERVGQRAIVGLDSIGHIDRSDAGRVLVIGSHGALHGGDPASALPVDAAAAFFHDAGIGRDEAGCSRLPVLEARGIPAACIDHRSARIGDARSMWERGVLSRVNAAAVARGVAAGMRLESAARLLATVSD